MQRSEAPHHEFSRAQQAVGAMKTAASLEMLEEHWKQFLHRLERVWNKTTSHYSKSPKWDSWSGKFVRLRRQDPLLAYLVNARGAEEHSVAEIVDRAPASIGINPAPGTALHIDEMTIDGDSVHIRSANPLVFSFMPARMHLLPITNRGKIYQVPENHLGEPVNPLDVISVAELGLTFYAGALASTEAHLVK